MSSRRVSLLTALLLTAVLMCAMPGLFRSVGLNDLNRMDERLRPARARTLTVWLLSDQVNDRRLIGELCTAYEKAHEGVRVFLRRVSASELENENAVAPDVALYTTGTIVNPEQLFVPLGTAGEAGAAGSASSGGVPYGVPLWFSPNVLMLPSKWTEAEDAPLPSPKASSFFELGTPAPTAGQEEAIPYLTVDDLPWNQLLKGGAIAAPKGVGLQQLLFVCPTQLRGELVAAMRAPENADAAATGSKSAATSVETLASYYEAVQAGKDVMACPLAPAVCDNVRYASLCRDGEDARAFVLFLLSDAARQAALARSLLPSTVTDAPTDQLTAALIALYQNGMLFPNAFAHARAELEALCQDAFWRTADPVETLLRLR